MSEIPVCSECGQVIEGISLLFTIVYDDGDLPVGYLCSIECLSAFLVVVEAEAILDKVKP